MDRRIQTKQFETKQFRFGWSNFGTHDANDELRDLRLLISKVKSQGHWQMLSYIGILSFVLPLI